VKVLARAMRRHPSTVWDLLKRSGGVRPAPRRRWELRLSLAEREEISRGLAAGESLRTIAARLGRAPSTVSRDVAGNGGRGRYRALAADRAAWARACRPKQTKLARWPGLRSMVDYKLELRWSPEQIAGWLRRRFPTGTAMHVSHETTYRSLFVQTRGDLRHECRGRCRTGPAKPVAAIAAVACPRLRADAPMKDLGASNSCRRTGSLIERGAPAGGREWLHYAACRCSRPAC
jgi:DNA-binding CsgD family transcriptional regulator